MNLPDARIRKIFSGIYAAACLDEKIKMRDFAANFEGIREQIFAKGNTKCWNLIKLDKDFFYYQPNLDLLLKLQQLYYAELTDAIVQNIQALIVSDPRQAWETWLQEYADAIINWCSSVYIPLCDIHFNFDEEKQKKISFFKKLNQYILYEKWANTFPSLESLTKEPCLSSYQLSCLNVIAGQVVLYWMPKMEECMDYFGTAQKLSPENCRAERAMGEYYLRREDYEKARNHFLNSISLEPTDTENYIFMANSYKEEKKLETAEQWYKDAVNINLLATQSLGKLMQVYGDPEWPGELQQQIDELLAQSERIEINIVSENGLYNRYRDAGQAYFAKQDYTEATKYFEKAYTLRPDLPAAKLDIGYMYGYRKEFAAAQKWFDLSIATADEAINFDTYWACAWLYEQATDIEPTEENRLRAIGYYEKCAAIRPALSDIIYNATGILYYNSGLYKMAIDYYIKAININPTEAVYTDNYTDALSKLKDYSEFEINTIDPYTLNDTGNFFYKADDYIKAKQYYTLAIDRKPDPVFYENLGHANNRLLLFEEAEAAYKKAVETAGNTGHSSNYLGVFYYNRRRYDAAIACYKKALEKEAENETYLQNLAYAYESVPDYDAGLKIYNRLVSINPSNHGAWYGLALICNYNRDYDAALPAIIKALELQPDNIAYLKTGGSIYENLGNDEAALKIYQKALGLNDTDEYFYNRIGIIYYRQGATGSLKESIAYYTKAIHFNETLESKKPDAHIIRALYWQNIAFAYADLNEFDDAEKAYLKSIDTDPDAPDNYYMAGNFYFKKEDWKTAIQMFEAASRRDENNPLYYRNLAEAYNQAGDIEDAGKMFTMALEKEKAMEATGN